MIKFLNIKLKNGELVWLNLDHVIIFKATDMGRCTQISLADGEYLIVGIPPDDFCNEIRNVIS